MVAALPGLKARQAIAAGKGFKTNMSIISEVDDIQEEKFEIPNAFKESDNNDESDS